MLIKGFLQRIDQFLCCAHPLALRHSELQKVLTACRLDAQTGPRASNLAGLTTSQPLLPLVLCSHLCPRLIV